MLFDKPIQNYVKVDLLKWKGIINKLLDENDLHIFYMRSCIVYRRSKNIIAVHFSSLWSLSKLVFFSNRFNILKNCRIFYFWFNHFRIIFASTNGIKSSNIPCLFKLNCHSKEASYIKNSVSFNRTLNILSF